MKFKFKNHNNILLTLVKHDVTSPDKPSLI